MSFGPAPVPVGVGPGVQARGERARMPAPRRSSGLLAQRLVSEQEHPPAVCGPTRPAMVRPNTPRSSRSTSNVGPAGQLLQVAVVQAAAARGDQAEYLIAEAVVAVLVGGQDLIELPAGPAAWPGWHGGDIQPADRGSAERVIGVDVGGHRRVGRPETMTRSPRGARLGRQAAMLASPEPGRTRSPRLGHRRPVPAVGQPSPPVPRPPPAAGGAARPAPWPR